jgi:hypothetical protein
VPALLATFICGKFDVNTMCGHLIEERNKSCSTGQSSANFTSKYEKASAESRSLLSAFSSSGDIRLTEVQPMQTHLMLNQGDLQHAQHRQRINRNWRILNAIRVVPYAVVLVCGVFAVYASRAYVYSYLSDIAFDNTYLTAYFRHVDLRRRAQLRRFLLPLLPTERYKYTKPLSLSLSSDERKTCPNLFMLCFSAFFAAFILYMNFSFEQFLLSIAKHFKIEKETTKSVDFSYHVNGELRSPVEPDLNLF